MNLKQLEYFVAIAEEQQISAAAKKLHIAQPPLSYQLKLLEEELGTVLVKRGLKKSELTDAGKLLYSRAEQILAMASATAREVESYGKGMRGVLSIGAITSCGGTVPNQQMLEFTENYPDIRFEIREGNTFSIIDMLEKGIIDVGIVRTPFPNDRLHCRFAALEPMTALMTADRVCGQDQDSVTLQELSEQPLIIYRRFETLIQGAFADEGITPFVCCINEDARTTYTWALKGFGVGIIPKSILTVLNPTGLVCKDIVSDRLMTQIAIIWEKDRYLSPLAQRFIELFEE